MYHVENARCLPLCSLEPHVPAVFHMMEAEVALPQVRVDASWPDSKVTWKRVQQPGASWLRCGNWRFWLLLEHLWSTCFSVT